MTISGEELRGLIKSTLVVREMSRSNLARTVGVSKTTITRFLNGNYSGDISKVEAALLAWLKSTQRVRAELDRRLAELLSRFEDHTVAKATGVEIGTVARWRSRVLFPSLLETAELLKLANVSADWLLGTGVFAEGDDAEKRDEGRPS